MSALALNFNNTPITTVSHNNQIWLTSVELAKSLGYSKSDSISRIFDRNKDEFSEAMSTVLTSPQIDGLGESSGLQREQRIFSLRGCHLLAMFSRTAIAKEFRKWVLDILDNQKFGNTESLPEPKTRKALPNGLTTDQQDTIKALVKSRAEGLPKDKQAGAIIKQWSAIKKKYGMSYKEVAPEHFVNIISLITRLPIEGELVEKEGDIQHNSITINLAPLNADRRHRRWLVTQALDEMTVLMQLDLDQDVKTREQFIRDLIAEGYIVMKKEDILNRLK